jgi:hypothetical protein
MIRLTWREFRTQAAVAFGALIIAAIALAVTGVNLAHLYNTTVANCQTNNDCSTATPLFLSTDGQLQTALDILMIVIPALIGIFWGAPLIARELEVGTHRLAWTQSVTRTRWLAVKIGLVGVCSLLVTGLLSLMVTWWFSPIDRVNMNVFGSFDQRDIVPIGYAAFAFALGVSSGALLRRTLLAMPTTLAGFVVARLAIVDWVRPYLMAPLQRTVPNTTLATLFSLGSTHASLRPGQLPSDQGALPGNAWLISDQTINAAGHVIGQNGFIGGGITMNPGVDGHGVVIQGVGNCPDLSLEKLPLPTAHQLESCIDQFHIRDVLTYQPGGRYWPFQWFELAIYLTLALVLVGLSFWWIRRRVN